MSQSLGLEAVDALRTAPPLAAVSRLAARTLVHAVRAAVVRHWSLGKLGTMTKTAKNAISKDPSST